MDKNSEERLRMILMSQFANKEKGWLSTQAKITKERRNRKYTFIAGAASIAAIMILSIIIFAPYNPKPRTETVISAEPGKYQAVLIMSDGESISLADSSNLHLRDVSGTKISIEDGKKIKYEVIEKEAADTSRNTIIVPRAGFYSLTLSDGTQVWINSESSLTYPVNFSGKIREVTLTGEAYFEVAHNPDKPFIVNCHQSSITVTGTEFNIDAYNQDRTVTTLVNGGVILKRGSFSAILKKGMQGYVSNEGIKTEFVNVNEYTSWKDGIFEFENTTLEQITTRLSRWYDVEFDYQDTNTKNLTFTATFPKEENLSLIIQIIEKISPARFSIKDGKIVVNSTK